MSTQIAVAELHFGQYRDFANGFPLLLHVHRSESTIQY